MPESRLQADYESGGQLLNILECTELEKEYNGTRVVDKISFKMKKGETLGLLGPNGAGKTTTISMLSAQIKQSGGTIQINGHEIKGNELKVKSLVGVVPQDIALYPELNAYENLQFFGSLYKLDKKQLKEKIDRVLDLIGLKDRAKDPIKQYSGGMKRRINIAAAILHDPLVVFMDEPTVGIDPQSRNKIYELIALLKEQGMSIVYTTHYMEEATNLCDRVAIVDRGKMIQLDSVKGLIKEIHGGILEFQFRDPDTAQSAKALAEEYEHVKEARVSDSKLEAVVRDPQENIGYLVEQFRTYSYEIINLTIMPPTLETLFLYKTGKALRD